MISIEKFSFEDKQLFKQALNIRVKVFVEEQNVPLEMENDEFDEIATHYLVTKGGEPIAAARWVSTDEGIKLERFAVLKEHRRKGLGYIILQQLLNDVVPINKDIYLHAQVGVESFYEKYGFIVVGERFEEAGIEHCKMMYER